MEGWDSTDKRQRWIPYPQLWSAI